MHELLWHIDQRVLLLNPDGANGFAWNVGMVGNRADHIIGADPMGLAGVKREAHHTCLMRVVASLAITAGAAITAVAITTMGGTLIIAPTARFTQRLNLADRGDGALLFFATGNLEGGGSNFPRLMARFDQCRH